MFHMLEHRTSLSKFRKTEVISSIFSEHNAVKLEIDHKKKTEEYTKTWKLSNKLLTNEWVNNKIREEIKRYIETNENEDITIQNPQDTGKAILRGKFIALQAYLKTQEKAQINNLTLYLKELEKE